MKEFRQEIGMSQRKFAEYFNLPLRTLQDWEQGRHEAPSYLLPLLKRIWNMKNEVIDYIVECDDCFLSESENIVYVNQHSLIDTIERAEL